jgi:hypothetical protein
MIQTTDSQHIAPVPALSGNLLEILGNFSVWQSGSSGKSTCPASKHESLRSNPSATKKRPFLRLCNGSAESESLGAGARNFLFFLCSAGEQTLGLVHVRKELYL